MVSVMVNTARSDETECKEIPVWLRGKHMANKIYFGIHICTYIVLKDNCCNRLAHNFELKRGLTRHAMGPGSAWWGGASSKISAKFGSVGVREGMEGALLEKREKCGTPRGDESEGENE